jgi:hypothetical protein
MSITPHLVRAPKVTEADLQSVLIGTRELTRLRGARAARRPRGPARAALGPSPAPTPAPPVAPPRRRSALPPRDALAARAAAGARR